MKDRNIQLSNYHSFLGSDDDPLSLNLYTFCMNDPVNFIDPTGHYQVSVDDETYDDKTGGIHDSNGNVINTNGTLSYDPNHYSEEVVRLQRMLGITTDGYFGSDTKAAVMRYQRDHKLDVDGVVGEKTWASLLAGPSRTPAKHLPSGHVVSDTEDVELFLPKPGETYITKYDPSKTNPLLWSSDDANLPYSLQEQLIDASYQYGYARTAKEKKYAIDELLSLRDDAKSSFWLAYYNSIDSLNKKENQQLIQGILLSAPWALGAIKDAFFLEEGIEVVAFDGISNAETKYAYNMIENPGPLAEMRGNPASNFLAGKYNVKTLDEDIILYRSGKAGGLTIPGEEQNALGQWFTREPAESVAKVRIDSAVKAQWIDPKTGVLTGTSPIESTYAIKIPEGTTIYEGPVGYQGGSYLGGENCNQIFIQEPWKIDGVQPLSETPIK